MADKMDAILRAVADEADRGVDYAALHDAILVAHKKTNKRFSHMVRTLSYAAAFVVVAGLGALALSGGFLNGVFPGAPESAVPYGALRAAEDTTQAQEAIPAEPGDATGGAAEDSEMPKLAEGGAGASEETPMFGVSSSDVPSAFDPLAAQTLAAEVLKDKNAVAFSVAALKNEPDRSAAGQLLTDEFSCNTSYNSVYIEPLEGAPELSTALVSDKGNGELHIYWSASSTLHVFSCTIGYTAEDAIALLAQIG